MQLLNTLVAITALLIDVSVPSPISSAHRTLSISSTTPNPIVNRTAPMIFIPSERNDQCGASSFQDQTVPGSSPLTFDCLTIPSNIASGGRWSVEAVTANKHQLVHYGTCALGVQNVPPYGDAFFYVGNSDIIDVISDSVQWYGRDGVVAANGTMRCRAAALGASAMWEIYHT